MLLLEGEEKGPASRGLGLLRDGDMWMECTEGLKIQNMKREISEGKRHCIVGGSWEILLKGRGTQQTTLEAAAESLRASEGEGYQALRKTLCLCLGSGDRAMGQGPEGTCLCQGSQTHSPCSSQAQGGPPGDASELAPVPPPREPCKGSRRCEGQGTGWWLSFPGWWGSL